MWIRMSWKYAAWSAVFAALSITTGKCAYETDHGHLPPPQTIHIPMNDQTVVFPAGFTLDFANDSQKSENVDFDKFTELSAAPNTKSFVLYKTYFQHIAVRGWLIEGDKVIRSTTDLKMPKAWPWYAKIEKLTFSRSPGKFSITVIPGRESSTSDRIFTLFFAIMSLFSLLLSLERKQDINGNKDNTKQQKKVTLRLV